MNNSIKNRKIGRSLELKKLTSTAPNSLYPVVIESNSGEVELVPMIIKILSKAEWKKLDTDLKVHIFNEFYNQL